MTNFLTIVRLVLTLLPLLIDTVKAIETAVPATGQGSAKLEMIRSTIEAAYIASGEVAVQFATLWPALQTAVAGVVTVFNNSGLFKKSS